MQWIGMAAGVVLGIFGALLTPHGIAGVLPMISFFGTLGFMIGVSIVTGRLKHENQTLQDQFKQLVAQWSAHIDSLEKKIHALENPHGTTETEFSVSPTSEQDVKITPVTQVNTADANVSIGQTVMKSGVQDVFQASTYLWPGQSSRENSEEEAVELAIQKALESPSSDTPINDIASEPASANTSTSAGTGTGTGAGAGAGIPPTPSPSPSPSPSEPSEPSWLVRTVVAARDWLLGGNTVLRVGIVVLFLGLAYLLRFVTKGMVLPPQGPYVGSALVALILIGLGWRLRLRRTAYALVLQGTGIAVLYLTVFAGIKLYPTMNSGDVLISSHAGFAVLVVLTMLSAALAILQDAVGLAASAALGGFAAPVLASTGGGNHVALFSYFTLLNLGIFAIAWFKAWRMLNLIGFWGTFSIGLTWGMKSYTPDLYASVQPFLLVFFLLYVVIGLLFAHRRLRESLNIPEGASLTTVLRMSKGQSNYVDGTLLLGPALVGFGMQYAAVQHMPWGPAFSALVLGLFYMGLARWLARGAEVRTSLLVEVYMALGVIFGTLAIPFALDARWTGAAWAVEGAGIYWLGLRQQRPVARMFALFLQVVAAGVFLWDLDMDHSRSHLLLGSPLGALMLGSAWLSMYWNLRRSVDQALPLLRLESVLLPVLAVGGVFFLCLIPPLCGGAIFSTIAWALLGCFTLWVGLRLRTRLFVLCGMAVQCWGWLVYSLHSRYSNVPEWQDLMPVWYVDFWTPATVTVALAAGVGAWLIHRALVRKTQADIITDPGILSLRSISNVLLLGGVGWWGMMLAWEVARWVPEGWPESGRVYAWLLLISVSVALYVVLAWREQWRTLAGVCLGLIPVAWAVMWVQWWGVTAPYGHYHLLGDGGWLAWLTTWAVYLWSLRRLAPLLPPMMVKGAHVLGCWLVLSVLSLELFYLFDALAEEHNAWRWLGWILVPSVYLMVMTGAARLSWPIKAYEREYRGVVVLPVALVLFVWCAWVNLFSHGSAQPLPYLPLLNPLELGMMIVLLAIFKWARRIVPSLWPSVSIQALHTGSLSVLGVSLFALVTMSVCRTAHHWGGVPFAAYALQHSMIVQAGWSILWALIALGLMIAGHLRVRRLVWITGAVLIAIVVAKLFLIDRSNSGGLERIISFIGVGVLMLVIGYFAPMPPRTSASKTQEVSKEIPQEAAHV